MNMEKIMMKKRSASTVYTRPEAEVVDVEARDVILSSFFGPEDEQKPEVGPWIPVN